jgi:UDPglucose 6-dehydrogenase
MTLHRDPRLEIPQQRREPSAADLEVPDSLSRLQHDDRSVAELCQTVDPLIPGAPRLTVIGTGYLGATHAICMAARGYEVVGVDVDSAKIDALRNGQIPFHEPGLQELLAQVQKLDRLRFTTSFEEAAAFGDVHFVCVGTPQRLDGPGADLTYVNAAVDALAAHLHRPALVVGKSTVPVGTAAALARRLRDRAPVGDQIELAWNPEFLREAHAVADTMAPDRLVFGVTSARAEAMLRRAFQPVIARGTPIEVMDLATAELVKVAANSFLATKISFINAMSEICDLVGADIRSLSSALKHDARIGGKFLQPGLGFGGGCLPKDIRAFRARVDELGGTASVTFLHEVDLINERCRSRVVDMTRDLLGGSVAGKRIAVLGAAFKPDSDDIRDSPALDVASQLAGSGAIVQVTDPAAVANARRARPELSYCDTAQEACVDADAVLLLTEWRDYTELHPRELRDLVGSPVMIDARHALDGAVWAGAGWTYRAPGAPEVRLGGPAWASDVVVERDGTMLEELAS